MTREELLTRLLGLLPPQFELVLFRAAVPPELLPANAAQMVRAIDAVRYLEQRDELGRLAQILGDVGRTGIAAVAVEASQPLSDLPDGR
jgi:hypothetical protein